MRDENSEKNGNENENGPRKRRWHTLSKHVRNKLEILHDKRRENIYISYFESAECAEEYTSRAMSANKDVIASWSSKAAFRARRALEYIFDTAVGFGRRSVPAVAHQENNRGTPSGCQRKKN